MKKIHPSKTAILIFSLSNEAENKRKPFLKKNNTALKLNTLVLNKVASLGVDYYHFTEKEQHGDTFGERITQSIASVFNKGYEQVLTIGNDSLSLTKDHLRKAIKAMDRGEIALGPSYDGGFYLLGLNKNQFKEEFFNSLSWNSATLCKEIRTYTDLLNTAAYLLPYLYDLDNSADIRKNKATLSAMMVSALGILQELEGLLNEVSAYILAKAYKTKVSTYYNKGSPVGL